MRELNLDLGVGEEPFYLRLSAALRHALQQGRLRSGELLPSSRHLAVAYGVHRHTVMAAMEELQAEGWVAPERGRGYRIATLLPSDFYPRPARRSAPAAAFDWTFARVAEVPEPPDPTTEYRFPSGLPDLRLFPCDEYFACWREVMRNMNPRHMLGYGDPGGTENFIRELRTYLRRLRGIDGGEMVVTHGSQEAIFLLGQLLLSPGDVVAVETLGYRPAWEALRASGASLVGVDVEAEGACPESLERILSRQRIKLLYLTPLHQYPTTVTLPIARRRHLYALAQRHGFPILEDDYDHEFHYRSKPVAPMKSDDPAGLVLYVSTFSKVLYPAARLGFAVVPPAVARPLSHLKRIVSRQNDQMLQESMARWMASGGFERHLRRNRRAYEQRLQAMVDALEEAAGRRHLPLDLRRPDGGMSVWVSLGVDADALAEAASRRGVAIQPGSQYLLEPGPSRHVRLGFASSHPQEIQEGVRRLVDAAWDVKKGGIQRDAALTKKGPVKKL